ncbi:MAG: tyrosine-type recombinase/integrase [Candidatus Aenigmatarchaeota archaeon]
MKTFFKIENMRLFQRENGIWYVEFYRGKKKSLGTRDRKLAERLFKELQKEALKGKLIFLEKTQRITLDEFIQEYVTYAEAVKAPTTAYRDKYALQKFREFLGNISLAIINVKRLEDYITFLRARGRKASSINIELRHLKSAFSKAKEWGYLRENPFAKIKLLKEEKTPPAFILPDEMKKIFDYLREKDLIFYKLVFFTLETGARRIEVLRARWEDIDWKRKIIILHGKGNKKRVIPLSSRLEKVLEGERKDKGKLFPYEHHDTLSHKWQKVMKALGLKYRFHDIRHTTASWLVMNGVSLKVVQELLGHSDIRTTQIYAHLAPEVLREAIETGLRVTPKIHPVELKVVK